MPPSPKPSPKDQVNVAKSSKQPGKNSPSDRSRSKDPRSPSNSSKKRQSKKKGGGCPNWLLIWVVGIRIFFTTFVVTASAMEEFKSMHPTGSFVSWIGELMENLKISEDGGTGSFLWLTKYLLEAIPIGQGSFVLLLDLSLLCGLCCRSTTTIILCQLMGHLHLLLICSFTLALVYMGTIETSFILGLTDLSLVNDYIYGFFWDVTYGDGNAHLQALNTIQSQLKCCGLLKYEDYGTGEVFKMNITAGHVDAHVHFPDKLAWLETDCGDGNRACMAPVSCCTTQAPGCNLKDPLAKWIKPDMSYMYSVMLAYPNAPEMPFHKKGCLTVLKDKVNHILLVLTVACFIYLVLAWAINALVESLLANYENRALSEEEIFFRETQKKYMKKEGSKNSKGKQ